MTKLISENPLMFLPENFQIPGKTQKRAIQKPDIASLKEGQRAAYDTIMEYLGPNEKNLHMMLMIGYAGTGKSFTINTIIEDLLWESAANKAGINIAVTAPTNKAVKVNSNFCVFNSKEIQFSTIHKLLGLKEQIDDGVVKFVKSYDEDSKLDSVDILFIDESSMLQDELFNYIQEDVERRFLEHNPLKVILVGDGAQIPPVGKMNCIPFTKNGRDKYKIGLVELTEVVRQKNGSPITEHANMVRNLDFNFMKNKESIWNENGNLLFLEQAAKDRIYHICKTYFCSDIFKEYPDFMKIIAWRNKTVNATNDKIRSFIYADYLKHNSKLPKIMVGEKLVADEPIAEKTTFGVKILFNTNDEFEVVRYTIESRETYKNKDVAIYCKFYETVVRGDDGTEKQIRIIHEDDQHIIDTISAELVKRAKAASDRQTRSWIWRTYFDVVRHFAAVKYNYALTAHKAQGSTFNSTMVLAWDILTNRDTATSTRILYTAMTRPTTNLCLVV